MFESSAPFTLFDYFRVPYRCVALEVDGGTQAIVPRGRDRALTWPAANLLEAGAGGPAAYRVESLPIFGRVVRDAEMRDRIRRLGGAWTVVHPVHDLAGAAQVSAIWQRDDGSVFLPFDPNEVISNYWTERYLDFRRTRKTLSLARRSYYLVRPILPRTAQMTLRRSFAHLQSRASFPRWPIETALHDLYSLLFDLVVGVADEPVPFIDIWPKPSTWALVLTHDVEGETGYASLRELLDAELELGYRSSWNFVPEANYVVEEALLDELRVHGFEIGVTSPNRPFHADYRRSGRMRTAGMRSVSGRLPPSARRR
jgi:hypothetical protein